MIKRRILVRLTRLGLAMYSMIWCMSFTVCASDHPLADLAVQDSVSVLSETIEESPNENVDLNETADITDTEDLINTTEVIEAADLNDTTEVIDTADLSNTTDPIDSEDFINATENEEDPEEDSLLEQEEDDALVGAVLPDEIYLAVYQGDTPLDTTSITPSGISESYTISAMLSGPAGSLFNIEKISWLISKDGIDCDTDNIEGVAFTSEGDTATLTFDGFNQAAVFTVSVFYTDGEGSVSSSCSFTVTPYSSSVTALSFGDYSTDTGILMSRVYDIIDISIYGTEEDNSDARLDPDRMKWGLVETDSTDLEHLNTTWNNVSLKTSVDDYSGLTATLNSTDSTVDSEFDLIAIYANDESSNVTARIHVTAQMRDDNERSEVSAVELSESYLTVTDLSQTYTVSADSVPLNGNLEPSRLSFSFCDSKTGKALDSIEGISLQQEGRNCILDFSELKKSADFILKATYTNKSGDVLSASCFVAAPVLISQLGADVTLNGAAYEGDNRISYTNLTSTENFTINLKSLNPSGAAFDSSKVVWDLSVLSSISSYNLNSTPVKGTGFECTLSRDGKVNLRLDKKIVGHEQLILSATYHNIYTNAYGDIVDNYEDYVSYSFFIEVDNPDNVSGIKMSEKSLTLTRFTGASSMVKVLSSDGKGVVDNDRLSFVLLDENMTETSSIDNIGFQRAAPREFYIFAKGPNKHAKFYIKAKYTNSNGTELSATLPVVIQYVIDDFTLQLNGANSSIDKFGDTYTISSTDTYMVLTPYITFYYSEIIDPDRMTVTLLENGTAVDPESGISYSLDGRSVRISSIAEFNTTRKLSCKISYNNTYTDADGKVVTPANPEKTVNIIIDTRPTLDTIEAHLPETQATVQLYKTSNEIPYLIRYIDEDRGAPSYLPTIDYSSAKLVGVKEADEKIIGYLNTTASSDSSCINVNLAESYIGNSDVMAEITKKKSVQARLSINLDPSGFNKTFTTEIITLTFGTTKPVVKAAQELTFNSYYAGAEGKQISFTGADVEGISFADEKTAAAAAKAGLEISGTMINAINTTSLLPATSGKKTLNIVAHINDPEYRLPSDYSVTVPVKYTVKNTAPKVQISGGTSFTFNTVTDDSQTVYYSFVGNTSDTALDFRLLNAKGKSADGVLDVTITNASTTIMPGDPSIGIMPIIFQTPATVVISCNSNTQLGQTYKVAVFAKNTLSDREGPATTITVKTVNSKNSLKPSVSLKTKGSIDACLPGYGINITVSGKNINIYSRGIPSQGTGWTVKCEGTDISDLFNLSPAIRSLSGSLGLLPIIGLTSADPTKLVLSESVPFDLLKSGYAGKKATLTIDYGEYPAESGNHLKASYTFKIGKTTVSPKLNVTAVSYNPEYETVAINTSVKNLFTNVYNYTVSMSCGKQTVNWNWIKEYGFNGDIISITPGADISKYAGKTVTVKITPTVPLDSSDPEAKVTNLPAKAATLSIKVLNTAKAKPTLTAKTSGTIDALRNASNVTVSLSYKNLYLPAKTIENVKCEIYMQKKVNGKLYNDTYDNYFDVLTSSAFQNKGFISINASENAHYSSIPVGTYKARISVYLKGHYREPLVQTVSFKVTRGGKTGLSVTQSGYGKLTNRDSNGAILYNVSVKDNTVNEINYICLGGNGKYSNMFHLYYDYDLDYYFTISLSYGYIEKSKGKPITKAVTRTIPVEIYYYGCNVPDIVNLKVTINP